MPACLAFLSPSDELSIDESLLGVLDRAADDQSAPGFDRLANDIIACLEIANREWDGPIPLVMFDRVNRGVIDDLREGVDLT